MKIDENAPAIVVGEIKVNTSPESVWDTMAEIERWPEWNPDIKWASLEGDLAEGTSFRWKSGPGTITSTLRAVERPRLLAWTGKMMGIHAVHVWRIESRDGQTIVHTEESWDGLLVSIFRGLMRKALQKAIDAGLGYLKDEAERST